MVNFPQFQIHEISKSIAYTVISEEIQHAIHQADMGATQSLMDLAHMMRQKGDGHLHGVLYKRENALNALKWEVFYPELPRSQSETDRVTIFCTNLLNNFPAFENLVTHIAGAFFFGFSVSHIIWKTVPGKELGLPMPLVDIPAEIRFMPHRLFAFDHMTGEFGYTGPDGGNTIKFPLSKYANEFIVSQPRITGDVPNKEGLCRVLIYVWFLRVWALKGWATFGEMTWKGIPMMKVSSLGNKDIIEKAKDLDRMMEAGSIVYTDDCDLKLLFPQQSSGGSGHFQFSEYLGKEISKAVLGQTLTTDHSKVGSHALGKVHSEVAHDLLEADAKYVASVITNQLLRPTILRNFGEVKIPKFRFITQDIADLEQFSKAVKILADLGLQIPKHYIYDVTGISQPKEGDELLNLISSSKDE